MTTHQAYGLGSYCFFNVNPAVVSDHAFEAPNTAGVKFHDLLTVSLGDVGHHPPRHQRHRSGDPDQHHPARRHVSYP